MSSTDKDKIQSEADAELELPAPDEQDVEGHNLLAMSDYYVQSKMGRQKDIDREARERALVKEAQAKKPSQR